MISISRVDNLLHNRYQLLQVLSSGDSGETYIAEDTYQPHSPKCVVKHIKTINKDPRYLESVRHRLSKETETLKLLGQHPQIPQLFAYFEENKEFYLVQEFIEGHLLSEELPIHNNFNNLWDEQKCINLLTEVLRILKFIHSHGVIHCNIKPHNLIRRKQDGKLFLIEFGEVKLLNTNQQVSLAQELTLIQSSPKLSESLNNYLSQNPGSFIENLGYIPPEQLIANPYPNSDIYALGIIAIFALTGLDIGQLIMNPDSNNFVENPQVNISDLLGAILNRMVAYDFKDRYQSAAEVLQALQPLISQNEVPKNISKPTVSSRSVLVNGVGIGIAVNTLAIAGGIFSLINALPQDSPEEILSHAQEQYNTGDINKAIALAKSIPRHSNVYQEAQTAIREWGENWKVAETQFKVTQKAFDDGRWIDVIKESKNIPKIDFWKNKLNPILKESKLLIAAEKQTQVQITPEIQKLLQKAYNSAEERDFTSAIQYLNQIPGNTVLSQKIAEKLVEYQQKQTIRANYLLKKSEHLAKTQDFKGAIELLNQIPKDIPAYTQAKAKIAVYEQQQFIDKKVEGNYYRSNIPPLPTIKNSFIQEDLLLPNQNINPGNLFREITPQQNFSRKIYPDDHHLL